MEARLVCFAFVLGLVTACSGKDDGDQDEASGSTGNLPGLSTSETSNSLSPSSDAPTATVSENEGLCTITTDDSECTGQMYQGENTPLDIYVMFDQSGSMCICVDPPKDYNECGDPTCNKTRITAVREAMELFLRDRNSAGISVGIGYFGQQEIGYTTCNEVDYATPAVTPGMLPDHADPVVASLDGIVPTGETPTGPAIAAACGVAQDWKRSHPGHKVVLLLLTDGEPKAPVTCAEGTGPCCPTIEDAVARTEACRSGNPSIDTYVLGVGPFLENLHQIAAAGGTKTAYLADKDGDVAGQVLSALNAIRNDASIPCQLTMPADPAGQTVAYDKVNIVYADPACNGTTFPYVESLESCTAEGGWYYDDPSNPQTMNLCPSSCEQVGAPGGQLLQMVGCQTVTVIL